VKVAPSIYTLNPHKEIMNTKKEEHIEKEEDKIEEKEKIESGFTGKA